MAQTCGVVDVGLVTASNISMARAALSPLEGTCGVFESVPFVLLYAEKGRRTLHVSLMRQPEPRRGLQQAV